MVVGVPSVRVPFDALTKAIKRASRTAYLIPRPLTTVKLSMPVKPSIGSFRILSATEGYRPASVNPTFLPFQPVRLSEEIRAVW
jgi:hypothetical protein